MPRIVFCLEEQFSDQRSNEVAYKFTVENQSNSAIVLLDTTTRTPEDVKFSEIKDSTSVAFKTKGETICRELTELLNSYLIVVSDDFRKRQAQTMKTAFDEVFGQSGNLFSITGRIFASMLTGAYTRTIERAAKRYDTYRIIIEDYPQSKAAYDRWLSNVETPYTDIRDIFQSKMERLAEIEKVSGANIRSSSLAVIEPESFFAQTYVFKFSRYTFDPRRSNISVEAVYSDADAYTKDLVAAKRLVGSATTSLIISPQPVAVTALAIFASCLGVTLRNAISVSPRTFVWPWPWNNFVNAFSSQATASALHETISAAILALLFYNIYEYTDLGKNISSGVGVGWRGALLIGTLCGLVGDKIIAALKALIGA